MTLSDYLVSVVRTFVPVVVSFAVARLVGLGIEVDSAAVEPVVAGLVVGAYYAVVRAAESRWPIVGVLLGWKAAPKYSE